MKVSQLTADNDWTFGSSLNNYLTDDDKIHQCLKTRLQCFTNDNWLHLEKHIDWLYLLSSKNTKKELERQVYKCAMGTTGIVKINSLNIEISNNTANIDIHYTNIFQMIKNLQIRVENE